MCGHLRMNTYCITSSTTLTDTEQLLCFSISVIDSQLWNLKRTRMREPYENHSLAIPKGRSEDLRRLHRIHWENYFVCLARHMRSLEMNSCRIGIITK